MPLKYILLSFFILLQTGCSCFTPEAEHGLKKISVAEVSKDIYGGSPKFVILDANPESVRSSKGTVPNARLLSSYDQYRLDELPADKTTPLVFYCFNEACGASTQAANRALTSGYKNVSVMEGGITGWNKEHPRN
ncbi:MAG TPA: rhodanese-like domain-containing protein [Cellvibrionaceae bacterium]|nr:rhodanese-like domain-containing protein [Cellvibrionaceae bacterium]HNG58541.1 rhodanese-like domain-containing protein [Cellvibrionaceae bacterium]